jgi:hypothetical protein
MGEHTNTEGANLLLVRISLSYTNEYSIHINQASGALHTDFPKPIPVLVAKHNSVIPKGPLGNLQ